MECLQLCQVVVLNVMFLNEFSTGKNQQKWWHMQQDLKTLRSMRCGGSGVSKCNGSSWPHTAWHSWFGRMLTCENSFDSKPQSKLFLSLFDKCHFTCLPCSRTFWKTTSKWFCKEKRNVRNIWKKSTQTTMVSMEHILCLAIMVKETCASTIFNSILKGNLKVLENNTKLRECA